MSWHEWLWSRQGEVVLAFVPLPNLGCLVASLGQPNQCAPLPQVFVI